MCTHGALLQKTYPLIWIIHPMINIKESSRIHLYIIDGASNLLMVDKLVQVFISMTRIIRLRNKRINGRRGLGSCLLVV
jgi:UDP-N-acetylenolpyruvoylglucosamine reductase